MDEPKRYFKFSDDYVSVWIVALSEEDAIRRMVEAGVEWGDPSSTKQPGPLELTSDAASKVMITNDEDDSRPRRFPLTECSLGEWFSTEW